MKTLLSKSNLVPIIALIIVSILTIVWVNANAEPVNLPLQPIQPLNPQFRTDIVGIKLSNVSITLVKLNSTTVPSYEKLIKLGYDNSNERSGKFIFKNGYLQRDFTKVKNELVYYNNVGNVTIVDPSEKIAKKIKMIIIEPSMKSYIIKDNLIKINNTRIVHKDLYVNSICTVATISSQNILNTLPVIIKYLMNNCTSELENIKDIIHDATTKTDITTSQKYKEDKFKQEIKLTYKTVSKIGSNDLTINRSVTEDKAIKYVPKVTPPFNYTKYR